MSRPIWYDSTETGAPTLNNAAGSLLEVLRACLVNGFNLCSVTSIAVASGVATATAATHGYSAAYGKLLRIEGAPVAGLNGDVQPLTVDTNTFTYAATGVPDGTYTGTITARRAPLDWIEAHTGTNMAIFKRSAPEATVSMLRVIDTKTSPASTIYAMATMVESATGVDAVTGEVPTVAAEQTWMRGADNATPKKWLVCGSGRRVWVMLQGSGSQGFVVPYLFGDPKPMYPGDSGGCVITGYGSTSATAAGGLPTVNPGAFSLSAGVNYLTYQRSRLGALNEKFRLCGAGTWGNNLYAAGGETSVPVVGDIYIGNAVEIRARLPELYLPQANNPFNDRQVYESGSLRLLSITVSTSNTGLGQMMLDLNSDWD